MPSGLRRFQKAETLHFITFSCFHRLPLLEVPGARQTFKAVLEQIRGHQARVYACGLMPEQVHLLVNEPPQTLLARLLKAVKQTTSAGGPGLNDLSQPKDGAPEPALSLPKYPSLYEAWNVGSPAIHGQDTRKPGRPSKSLRLAVNRA